MIPADAPPFLADDDDEVILPARCVGRLHLVDEANAWARITVSCLAPVGHGGPCSGAWGTANAATWTRERSDLDLSPSSPDWVADPERRATAPGSGCICRRGEICTVCQGQPLVDPCDDDAFDVDELGDVRFGFVPAVGLLADPDQALAVGVALGVSFALLCVWLWRRELWERWGAAYTRREP